MAIVITMDLLFFRLHMFHAGCAHTLWDAWFRSQTSFILFLQWQYHPRLWFAIVSFTIFLLCLANVFMPSLQVGWYWGRKSKNHVPQLHTKLVLIALILLLLIENVTIFPYSNNIIYFFLVFRRGQRFFQRKRFEPYILVLVVCFSLVMDPVKLGYGSGQLNQLPYDKMLIISICHVVSLFCRHL